MRKGSMTARLWPFLRPQLGLLLLCCAMVLVVNLSELAKPYILEIVIDRYLVAGRPDNGLDSVWGMGLAFLLCAGLSSGLNVLEAVAVNRMGQSVLMDIRRMVFRHIQHMPMRILDRFSSGRLITRATNDVETLNELFSDVLVNLFKDIFMLIGIVVTMLMMDWQLALLAFTGVPFVFLVTFIVRGKLRRNFVVVKALISRINGFFAENISGMRLVQIFRRERQKLKEFDEMNDAYYASTLVQVRMNSFMRPVMEVINALVIALLVWFGCRSIGLNASGLEIGVLYAFTNYIRQFFEPINDLAEKYATIQSAVVSTERIYELLDDKANLEDLNQGEPIAARPQGKIEFQHVWFAYDDVNFVLRDVSFTIQAGQSAAFVGATGAGKTTIISLVSRFYEIQKGKILLDGVDISTLSKRTLRRHIAVVLQDVFLFSGTIAENVRLGDEEISDREIDEALRLTCAAEFIKELPGGMDYPVTERGSTFSAGQRQLLSFARAIAHDPAVFVLDEATASIDTKTEQLIQQSVKNLSVGRTMIIIAHRLSTIRDCDTIFVMSAGRIVESGNHDDLMAQNGLYAALQSKA
ncbi:MAG: ABC transporter ATP-binding protein/permease [Christensenellaceae bacterium]|jgi:ATP-binding cassette subfamily B protein|nr:ABC transporter ATP-binding protein/permease [Christensenellaceae bacterium]